MRSVLYNSEKQNMSLFNDYGEVSAINNQMKTLLNLEELSKFGAFVTFYIFYESSVNMINEEMVLGN